MNKLSIKGDKRVWINFKDDCRERDPARREYFCKRGGIWTPASLMGESLVEKLRNTQELVSKKNIIIEKGGTFYD